MRPHAASIPLTRWLALGACFAALTSPPALAAHVNVIELDDQLISPVTQQYIDEALARSEAEGAACLVLQLDTPGGLLQSTRAIVKRIMNARVPVVVYVAPSGSRAGSAGVFITLASHVAAMAPSTNIGAAHPVTVGEPGPARRLMRRMRPPADGKDQRPDEAAPAAPEQEAPDPMEAKVLNDTIAWITTIAKTRGRNADWAAKAVTESVSVTETEAVKERIVDLVAPGLPELLQAVHGRRVELSGGPVELRTDGATIVRLPMSARQRFLAAITNPNIAYLLMMLGTLGLIFEFTHPGIGFPGIAGLICLLLALYAFQALPVSYAAAGLMILGLGLLIAELKIVSHGLLAVGGIVALTLGSLMLFESPDPALRVSLDIVFPTVATLALIILFVLQRALRAQSQPAATGLQSLIGTIGTASTELDPDGKVFAHGELWDATSSRPARKGEPVRITAAEGLRLRVEPLTGSHQSASRRAHGS